MKIILLPTQHGVRDPDIVAQGFRAFGALTRFNSDPSKEDRLIGVFVLNGPNLARLQLLVSHCPLLANAGEGDPFAFCEKLARQQIAGGPRAGRILNKEGENLLGAEEKYWNFAEG